MTGPEITDQDLRELVERAREATRALIQGDVRRYFVLVDEAPDYTLMPPNGGPTRQRADTSPAGIEESERFFPAVETATSSSSSSTCRATSRF